MTLAINLLPPLRDAGRRSRGAFRTAALLAFTLGVGASAVLHLYGRERVAAQRALNATLTRESNQLNTGLHGMAVLRAEVEAWVGLQASRARSARLLALLPHALPEGVYLRHLAQEGDVVTLRGVARSAQDLSGLLRRLAMSHSGFQQPELVEFTAVQMPVTGPVATRTEASPEDAAMPARTTQFTVRVRLVLVPDREPLP